MVDAADDINPRLAHQRELRVLRRIARRVGMALAGIDRDLVAVRAAQSRGSGGDLFVSNARLRDLLDDLAKLRKVRGH
jgi:hypothetical protein